MRVEPRIQEQRMGDAGDAGQRQRLRRRGLVVRDPVRHRAVQPDVVAECQMPPRAPLHHHQPAVRPDLKRDAMTGAIFSDRIDEYSLVTWHRWICSKTVWMAALRLPQPSGAR